MCSLATPDRSRSQLEAQTTLGVEARPDVSVAAMDAGGTTLATGERIDTRTVIWCAGMQASPLNRLFPVARDRFGRLPVKPSLKIDGLVNEFAAGDVAWFALDGSHICVMSCQHGRPMGRFAGHNVVCDLVGETMIPIEIGYYVTVLDLGAWGAVYTEGWDRHVAAVGIDGSAPARVAHVVDRDFVASVEGFLYDVPSEEHGAAEYENPHRCAT